MGEVRLLATRCGRSFVVRVVVAALGVLLVACSGTEEPPGASPLADFLGFGDAELRPGRDSGLAVASRQELDRQEAIADCMAAEGFDYQPVVAGLDATQERLGGAGDTTEEWVARYGLGISTLWFWQETLPSGLVGYTFDTEPVDPNEEIVAGLPEAEQEAYWRALYGEGFLTEAASDLDQVEDVEAGDSPPSDEPDLGCYGAAGPADLYGELLLDFTDELAAMEADIAADPRLVEVEAEISGCVGEKGFDYDGRQAAIERIETDMQELEDEIEPGPEGQPLALSAGQQQRLSEIQTHEVELALAIDGCTGDRSLAVASEVRADHEARFIERNRRQLEAFRDSLDR